MSNVLTTYLDVFAGLRVVVLGEAMLDSYLEGGSSRLCPEAPVPVVTVAGRRDAAGGAANTAANLRALVADVRILPLIEDHSTTSVIDRIRGTIPAASLALMNGHATS